MGLSKSRIIFVLAAFVILGIVLFLIESVMQLPSLSPIPVLTGLAFIFVGVYALHLLINDLRERRKAVLGGARSARHRRTTT